MTDKPAGFVSLQSLTKGTPDPASALDEIRRIYFTTARQTIEHDFAHAIALLKSLPDEEARSKAHVYMEGLAEMMREWEKSQKSKVKSHKSRGRTPRFDSTFDFTFDI